MWVSGLKRLVSGLGVGVWSGAGGKQNPSKLATPTVGTHPTGMNSCFVVKAILSVV